MLKIGGGELRGRKLHAPKGSETRPTGARLKKSLFDVLAPVLPGARVLDLYAGAGALGLEALSRGAASVVLVDRGRKASEAIRRNIGELSLDDRAELLSMDARAALSKLEGDGRRFDLVFSDPPYGMDALTGILTALANSELVEPNALVVVEHHHKQNLAEAYGTLERQRVLKAGESCFTLYRRVC